MYDRIDGPHHRLDVTITPRVGTFATPPHGILGQSFDGEWRPGRVGSYPRSGRVDAYPPRDVAAEFTTRAMAEGAIDGVASDYALPRCFATRYMYASFGAPDCAKLCAFVYASATDRSHLGAFGKLNATRARGLLPSAGATERFEL